MSRTGTCPNCGSPLTFEVGSSRAAVCRFCNTLVVRHGQDLASAGKVADLVPTGSRISLGTTGRFLGARFTVVGRVQMEWKQGVWDEWYASFPDERWGWLAEAGGRYYLTFGGPWSEIPPRHALSPGDHVDLGRHGDFVVTDLKTARIVSVAGELPEEVPLDGTVYSADLEGPNNAFATFDYGSDGDSPELFLGHELPIEQLDLQGGSAPEAGPEGDAIVCQNCGAPVSIRVPGQTVRLVCTSCNALIDGKKHAGRVIAVLERYRDDPPIAIGKKGKLRGTDVIVVGWMRRDCQVDFTHYPWDELLLYDPKTTAFSWLVCSDGHWSLAKSISAAEVTFWGNDATYRGKKYRRFSSVLGTVETVLGEFPWKVKVGEAAQLEDFTAPPEGLSLERNGEEMSWSHIEHLEPGEVAEAFGLESRDLPRRVRIGTFQPWVFESSFPSILRWMAGGAIAALALWCILVARDERVVTTHVFGQDDVPAAVDPSSEASEPLPPPGKLRSFVSEPFELTGTRAIEVRVRSDVDNSWAWIEGAVIREDTGDASFFGLETSYYHGYTDGESWSEGSTRAHQVLTAPARGTYVLRADLQWDPAALYAPSATIEIHEGGWSGGQFLSVLAVILSPLLLLLHRRSFDKRRWEDSNLIG
ncbi:Hypothetical protein A7982_00985 [Minicystis rosea]|nr:Hypothetical protein A7982_00985 [Minicystis rosea]